MRIKELDGLRALAVLAVIGYHTMLWGRYLRFLVAGWLGVDLFFVLSGFLITTILIQMQADKHYFRVFYARRALRILPPNMLFLFIYLGYSLAVGHAGKPEYWTQYIFYYTSLIPQVDRFTAYIGILPSFVIPGLGVMWSLSVEEIYYTIWAPVVRYASKSIFYLTLGLMFILAPIFRWFAPESALHYVEIYTFYCRMDALAYGSLIAIVITERAKNPAAWMISDRMFDIATIIAGFTTVMIWIKLGGWPTSYVVRSWGLSLTDLSFALVVYALVRHSGSLKWYISFFRWKPLRSIGMVSYSLYLCHFPCYRLTQQMVGDWHLSRRWNAFTASSLGLLASFAVAYALWYGMESRILRWKDRKVPSLGHVTKEAV